MISSTRYWIKYILIRQSNIFLAWGWYALIEGNIVRFCLANVTWNLFVLQWRQNEHDGVSNHRRFDCLLNRLFRPRSMKASKLRLTGLCEGNSPVIGEFPHKGPITRKMFPFDDVIMNMNHYFRVNSFLTNIFFHSLLICSSQYCVLVAWWYHKLNPGDALHSCHQNVDQLVQAAIL